MTRRGRSWEVCLLAVLLATSGCIGQMTTLEDPRSGDAPSDEGSPAHGIPPEARPTLRIQVHVQETSERALDVEDVLLDPRSDGIEQVQTEPSRVEPGTTRVIAAVDLAPGQRLPETQAIVHLDDGLGLARLPIHLASWTPSPGTQAQVTLTVDVIEPGTVAAREVTGDLPAALGQANAEPTYGYLLWPNGIKQPLPAFDHGIEVPATYPDLEAGTAVTFRFVDAPDRPVTWRLDGRVVDQGPTATITPGPGPHSLNVHVGEEATSHSLSLSVDDARLFDGAIRAGTGPVREHLEGVNGERHPIEVQQGARSLSAHLASTDADDVTTDLDLYLVNETGAIIDRSTSDDTSDERIHVPGAHLIPGEYALWVYAEQGVDASYQLEAHVFYR